VTSDRELINRIVIADCRFVIRSA